MESRLLYDRKEAARQLSISVRSLDYLIAGGQLETRASVRRCSSPMVRFLDSPKPTTTIPQKTRAARPRNLSRSGCFIGPVLFLNPI